MLICAKAQRCISIWELYLCTFVSECKYSLHITHFEYINENKYTEIY